MKSLMEIPRIGERTAHRFIEHFGSEEAALAAILEGDVAGLSEIEGVSEKFAISVVHEAIALNEGSKPQDFLCTQEAYRIYERVLGMVKRYAHTQYARCKLHTFFPRPASGKDGISRVRDRMQSALAVAGELRSGELDSLISRVRPVKQKYPAAKAHGRVIAACGSEYESIKMRYGAFIDVRHVEKPDELVDIARGYSHAIVIGTELAGFDYPEDITLEFADAGKIDDWYMVPEREIAFFAKNRDSISAAVDAAKLIRRRMDGFCPCITHEGLERLSTLLNEVGAGSGSGASLERLEAGIAEAEKTANDRFRQAVDNSSITVSGGDLLKIMGGGIRHIVEREIEDKYTKAVREACARMVSELRLDPYEAQYVSGLFSEEVAYPVRINKKALDLLKRYVQQKQASNQIARERALARELRGYRETVSRIVRDVLEFDVEYSAGCFALEYNMQMPVIKDEPQIRIERGRNLFLAETQAVAPVDYEIGGKHRVVLLSGVNSGGKTSVLELVAQTVILAHMGFPVPASCAALSLVDGIFFFSKSRGTMDAGAFEATLKSLSAIRSKGTKVVLADELESITEPGAAAKIIAGVLEEIHAEGGIAVFVSHLAESVIKNAICSVRVDGIEAKGLDENQNLIIERSPKYNCIARSTPELIVEKLAKMEGDEFYSRLLRKFEGDAAMLKRYA
ncbi:MAG TPA: hypothetical protein HA257_05865 [Candidatus Methanoperedenaceae archaeon]|nr:hypothetical protein [Candidatus Methanoperedenaceae archaeon]